MAALLRCAMISGVLTCGPATATEPEETRSARLLVVDRGAGLIRPFDLRLDISETALGGKVAAVKAQRPISIPPSDGSAKLHGIATAGRTHPHCEKILITYASAWTSESIGEVRGYDGTFLECMRLVVRDPGIHMASDLAIASDGLVYVVPYGRPEVRVFSATDGSLLRTLVLPGPCGSATDVAILPVPYGEQGRPRVIYVACRSSGIAVIDGESFAARWFSTDDLPYPCRLRAPLGLHLRQVTQPNVMSPVPAAAQLLVLDAWRGRIVGLDIGLNGDLACSGRALLADLGAFIGEDIDAYAEGALAGTDALFPLFVAINRGASGAVLVVERDDSGVESVRPLPELRSDPIFPGKMVVDDGPVTRLR